MFISKEIHRKIKNLNFINYFNLLEHFLGKPIETNNTLNVINATTHSTEIIIVNKADAISQSNVRKEIENY